MINKQLFALAYTLFYQYVLLIVKTTPQILDIDFLIMRTCVENTVFKTNVKTRVDAAETSQIEYFTEDYL